MILFILVGSFILLDLVSGVLKAFKKKEYNSSIMRQGLFHKAGSIAIVGFGVLVDYAQGYLNLGISIPLTSTICIYIIVMEIGSIIENLCEVNPEIIPLKLQSYFQKLSALKEKMKEVDSTENIHSKEE